jgi:hypothetical protein
MATTTNYGWGTPDDTDLVKDGALAIRDLGQDIDTTTKALNPETTTGDIAYRSATANTNTRLALGTAGQVLTVNSGATAPEWATSPGGKVLQVVYAETSTPASSSSTSFADTNLTATITPSSATSKVLVLVNQNGITKSNGNANNSMSLKLLRSATDLITFGHGVLYTGTTVFLKVASASVSYLDTPATTSATTYKTQFKNDNASASVSVQENFSTGVKSTIILMEIGA